jgi:hypothetical protein
MGITDSGSLDGTTVSRCRVCQSCGFKRLTTELPGDAHDVVAMLEAALRLREYQKQQRRAAMRAASIEFAGVAEPE